MERTIDRFIDHWRLKRDFPNLLRPVEEHADSLLKYEPDDCVDPNHPQAEGVVTLKSNPPEPITGGAGLQQARGPTYVRLPVDEKDLAPEDMPVTIVVKADSANTLASILDALGDWGDVENPEENSEENSEGVSLLEKNVCKGWKEDEDRVAVEGLTEKKQRQEWGEGDLQHKQRQRLIVSVARSGVGAVTSSDVFIARDCECPVFAHNVKADTAASRELKRVGGRIVAALPEGTVAGDVVTGVGGHERFLGRAREGRESVVVSETVGELLGEIERFVLRVR